MFEFEWDEAKRVSNIEKHGIDFKRARELFDGRPMFISMLLRGGEIRFSSVGVVEEEIQTVIWTVRGPKVRIISARKARNAERRQYRQLQG